MTFTFAPICGPDRPFSAEYAAQVVPGEHLPLFPMLMPEGWEHAPTQLRRTLFAGTTMRGIPDVALVYLVPTPNNGLPQIAWVRSERSDALQATPADFERVALFNVAHRQVSVKLDTFPTGAQVAMVEHDYLAAERILDVAFMANLATMLGVTEQTLLVGIPTRGMLVASAYTGSQNDGLLAQTIAAMFAEGRNKPISALPFLVKRGRLVAALEVA